ncbi:hypothetical protein J2X36_000750 [Methylobacterium sp. BE186]|uniref:hypothetical protein n=1 Tax=Methylobacterium sp. BE186 TaxID=2817715 RepID=UPI00285F4B23|nr:hypothetical protein [Methylobacterium sp. BE186]MDR7036014.1 hypothetical protein [Methylobacterium sp. BE186]
MRATQVLRQEDRANPLGTALDAFRAALVTFAREVADSDEAVATAAFAQARRAAEVALGASSPTETEGTASSYDMVVRKAVHFRVEAILDEAQAAIARRHQPS